MTSRFTELVIDCQHPQRLAHFWCEVLGYRILDDRDYEVEITGWDWTPEACQAGPQPPTLVFIRVPEEKRVKNRLHIDLRPVEADHTAEVQRIRALGASQVDIGQGEQPWAVLADPEGNEFCVLGSLADAEAAQAMS